MDKWSQEMIKVMIFFTVMSLVTSGLLYFAIRGFRICRREKKKAEEMLTWPTLTAIAIKSEVIYGARLGGKYRHYKPKITYIYNLNDKDYLIDVNDKKFYYFLNDELKAKNDAEQLGKSIVEEGKSIQIYYNPNDPSESAAEIDNKSCASIFVVIVVLSLFLLVFISFPLTAIGMIAYALFRHYS